MIYEALGLLASDVFERLSSTDATVRAAAQSEVDEVGARARLLMLGVRAGLQPRAES